MLTRGQGFRTLLHSFRWVIWGIGVGLLGLLSVYGYVRSDYASAAGDLEHQIQRAKSHGFPLTANDVRPKQLVRTEEDAAPKYRKLALQVENLGPPSNPRFEAEAERASELPGQQELSIATAHINSCKSILNLAQMAAAYPRYDFAVIKVGQNTLPTLDHLQFRRAIRLLVVNALVEGRNGNWDAAIFNFESASKLEMRIQDCQLYVSALLVVEVDSTISQGIETAATFAANSPTVLKRLMNTLDNLPENNNVLPYLKSEVLFGYQYCLDLERKHGNQSIQSSSPHQSALLGVSHFQLFPLPFEGKLCERAYASQILDFWNDAFDDIKAGRETHKAINNALVRMAARTLASKRRSEQVVALQLQSFEYANVPFEAMHMRRACARILCSALLFKLKNGRLPTSLKEANLMSTRTLIDPAISFQTTMGGFRVFDKEPIDVGISGKFIWEIETIQRGRSLVLSSYPSWERYAPAARKIRGLHDAAPAPNSIDHPEEPRRRRARIN